MDQKFNQKRYKGYWKVVLFFLLIIYGNILGNFYGINAYK